MGKPIIPNRLHLLFFLRVLDEGHPSPTRSVYLWVHTDQLYGLDSLI